MNGLLLKVIKMVVIIWGWLCSVGWGSMISLGILVIKFVGAENTLCMFITRVAQNLVSW